MNRPVVFTYESLYREVLRLGVRISRVSVWTWEEDGEIILGGRHDGVSIQFGFDGGFYYALSRDTADGKILFQDGTGNLARDLEAILG